MDENLDPHMLPPLPTHKSVPTPQSDLTGRPLKREDIARESQKLLRLIETRTKELTEDEKNALESLCCNQNQVMSMSYLLRLEPAFVYETRSFEFLQKLSFQAISLNKTLFQSLTTKLQEKSKIEKDTYQVECILRRTIGGLQVEKEELESQIEKLRQEAVELKLRAIADKASIMKRLAAVKSHLDEALPLEEVETQATRACPEQRVCSGRT
eukprot:Protomagalhaensia_sp_Gyna_25__2502@NODE_2405_length_1104_cov_358_869484_g1994_i0_p1_GENE_NODE_2405_length_1104_cov_358_869484_g1994_i0NODE_2405_length_1104_cov_358_869484_g1994_i0_p1_ORF_typecomplete_len212_score39_21ZapB/PF06005_12/3_3e03ZapB/PF06005_12/5_5e03ZapB/PF06005_12/0_027DUF2661/PF10860_8/0_065_3_exonuc/PF01367_20/4_8e035_3_exonuc/PF01367_20/0_12Gemin6/PF06372_12/2_1e02Gemin6/PF06372_12/0_33NRBF2/PF08961_10/2_1_NODE_2405_length_1104_cov_358_869484_g1994_i03921027